MNANLFLMEADMAMNACSTFVASFALVSIKGMPIWSANSCNIEKNIINKHENTLDTYFLIRTESDMC